MPTNKYRNYRRRRRMLYVPVLVAMFVSSFGFVIFLAGTIISGNGLSLTETSNALSNFQTTVSKLLKNQEEAVETASCEEGSSENSSKVFKFCINNETDIKLPINSSLIGSSQLGHFERHSMSGTVSDVNEASVETLLVSTPEELQAAIAKSDGGETILLKGGDWGGLTLADFNPASTVTFKSADPDNPAVFSNLLVTESSNITFEEVTFDYTFSEGDRYNTRPFQVLGSENVEIKNSVIDGDDAEGINDLDDGYGNAIGLWVRGSSDFTLTETELFNFNRGAVFFETDNLTVTNNDVHSMASDGFDFAEVQNVLIEGNHIHDFDAHENTENHKDMIQFWTNGTDEPSVNVVIRDNLLDQGEGVFTQSIFIRNEVVDSQGGGEDMFYQNFVIEDNVIINSHLHGIRVGETDGLKISNNTLVSKELNPDPIEVPIINVQVTSTNVTITDNIVESEVIYNEDTQVSNGNVIVQSTDPFGANFAGDFFANYFAENVTAADLAVVSDEVSATIGANMSKVVEPGHVEASLGYGRDALEVSYSLSGNEAENVKSVEWVFSDGTTKQGVDVTHTYSESGRQDATAKVTYENGEVVEFTKSVVLESPHYFNLEVEDGQAKDATGTPNGVHLGDKVTITTIDGKEGLSLNGDNVSIDATQDFLNNKQYSVSFDIAFNGSQDAGGRVLNFSSSFVMFMTPTSISLALTTDHGATWLKSSFPKLSADEWSAVTFTFNNDTGKAALYLNGEKLTEVSGLEGQIQVGNGSHKLTLGDPYDDTDMGVSLAELTYIGYELTEEEVADGLKMGSFEKAVDATDEDEAPANNDPKPVNDSDDTDPLVDDSDETNSDEGQTNKALFGTEEDDTMWAGSAEGQIVDGGAGNDVIATYDGDDTLIGGLGSDKLFGGNGNDILVADADDKRLDGGAGFDRLQFDESLVDIDMREFKAYLIGIEAFNIENDTNQTLTIDHRDASGLDSADGLYVFANDGDSVVFDDSSNAVSFVASGQTEFDGNLFNVFTSTRYKEEKLFYIDADASVYNSNGDLLSPLEISPLLADDIIA
ncbi:right-handed parallel beta-helix repeat-containing protein [Roseibium sp. HPY-6]|uniref:right-handed parallel beta-helix repeat-containing protein n=1 Tax=Roseibium sp. HPY-6 TaxID=3229852 RepID=UPI00338E6A9E